MVSIIGNGWGNLQVNGYICGSCGQFVSNVLGHDCSGTSMRQCSMCGQWVFGNTLHVCSGMAYPLIAVAPCQHCYCIDVPPSGERAKDHARCCKCSDVRVKESAR